MSSPTAAKHHVNPSPLATNPPIPAQHTPTNLPSLQPAAPVAVPALSAVSAAPTAPAEPAAPAEEPHMGLPQPQQPPQPQPPAAGHRKRKSEHMRHLTPESPEASAAATAAAAAPPPPLSAAQAESSPQEPKAKKSRTNTPWTPAEEQRLKQMRDAGNSWSEIAKTFPLRTEGSVKKHWYKDMHYAEFAEDESTALLAAIKEYEANKWKAIGHKVGKPAKACEQYAKEHFGGKM